MFLFNKELFFIISFSLNHNLISCIKTEIKFYINNVPTLFRCKPNGRLFYFNRFPNDENFHQNLTNNNDRCDLSLSTIDRRISIKLDRLEILCEIIDKKEHGNEFLFFSSTCSKDSCRKLIPSTATILTEYNTGDMDINQMNLIIYANRSTQLLITQLINTKYLVRR